MNDKTELKGLAVNFYSKLLLFQTNPKAAWGKFILGKFLQLREERYRSLASAYSIEETRKALMSARSLKAPGPDVFQPIFFKRSWEITGSALHSFTSSVLENGIVPTEVAEPF